jgi:multiple sugar transport system substrate-binding protein
MKIWKSIVIILSLSLLVMGCQTGSGSEKKDMDGNQADEKIKLTLWAGTGLKNVEGEESPNYGDWERAKAKRFSEMHPNVTIEVVSIPWGEIEQKVNVAVAGNNPPDILFDNVPMRIMKHAKNNQYESLEEVIADQKQDWKPEFLATGMVNDQLYALSLYTQPSVLFLNQTLFEAKGLGHLIPDDREWDWMQLKEALKQVVDKNVYGTAFFAKNNQSDQVNAAWLLSGGASWANDDFTEYLLNRPEGVEALTYMLSLIDEGLVAPGATSMQASDSIELFKQGKLAVIYNVPEIYGHVAGSDVKPYGIVPIFKSGTKPRMLNTGENGYALFKQKDENKRKMALAFIKFLTEPDNVKAISKNVLGVPARISSEYTIENEDFGELMKKIKPLEQVNLGKSVPYYADLRQKLFPELQAAFQKSKTPQQALDDFVKSANALALKK